MTDPTPHDTLPGTPLELPVPPELAEALGYSGPARFVGFYGSADEDGVVHTDGRNTGTGHGWPFRAFQRHRAVAPLLADRDLGSPDTPARHGLVLDRLHNRLSVAPLDEARAFLVARHPPVPERTPEDIAALRTEIPKEDDAWRTREVDWDEVSRLMDEHRDRIGRMRAFLDASSVPQTAQHEG